ncbi:unnamed protein product [Linum tenue]|uniref:anthocyanidin 3-O-glucosyltransferase n=1 Tax=Linum tenue TaxID=586396 RepID=A0AAV0Q9T2_9ROSI|nr:unnamed protein product [Linum tenue]
MFCTSIVDVANEFGVPSYVFYTCGATFLGFMFHLQNLYDRREIDPIALRDSDAELEIPGLMNPLPGKNLPSDAVEEEWLKVLVETTRRIREARGIIVNTYLELESYAVDCLSSGGNPPVYPVGPILNLKGEGHETKGKNEIIEWLDAQPPLGSFCEEQLKEIAAALERSGERFLWSVRRSPEKAPAMEVLNGNGADSFGDLLPGGFLERTAGRGKVIGWAPQTAVLAHRSSIWFGVPMAAWPIYAEQQLNAFKLVKELELAEEIRIDYRRDGGLIVTAEEIEGGIRRLMAAAETDGMGKKVKEMSEKGREALTEGGSSYSSMGRLIADLMDNKIMP